MKTFTQYITEIFDRGYDYQYSGRSHHNEHMYKFADDKSRIFSVAILHHNDGRGEVTFSDERGRFSNSGKSPYSAHKVFGTVRKIMRDHSEKFPEINSYVFGASKYSPSKVALYKKLAIAHGGEEITPDDYHRNFSIPTGKVK